MTENNNDTKPTIDHKLPLTLPAGQEGVDYLVCSIGYKKGILTKYGVTFPIPKTDEEAKARYDCTLADIITKGVRSAFSTAPAYQALDIWDKKTGLLKDEKEGMKALQVLADGYVPGKRGAGGVTQKIKAEKFDKIAEAAGADFDTDQILALIAKQKKENAKKTK